MRIIGRCCVMLAMALPTAAVPLPTDIASVTPDQTTEDFDWLRGRFADASPDTKAEWKSAMDTAHGCARDDTAAIAVELKNMGIAPTSLGVRAYRDERCAFALHADNLAASFNDWATFDAATREAIPIFEGFRRATEIAESVVRPDINAPLAERLRAALVGDQMLRRGANPTDPAVHAPRMSEEQCAFSQHCCAAKPSGAIAPTSGC